MNDDCTKVSKNMGEGKLKYDYNEIKARHHFHNGLTYEGF